MPCNGPRWIFLCCFDHVIVNIRQRSGPTRISTTIKRLDPWSTFKSGLSLGSSDVHECIRVFDGMHRDDACLMAPSCGIHLTHQRHMRFERLVGVEHPKSWLLSKLMWTQLVLSAECRTKPEEHVSLQQMEEEFDNLRTWVIARSCHEVHIGSRTKA